VGRGKLGEGMKAKFTEGVEVKSGLRMRALLGEGM